MSFAEMSHHGFFFVCQVSGWILIASKALQRSRYLEEGEGFNLRLGEVEL
jgi:hypothetical protein